MLMTVILEIFPGKAYIKSKNTKQQHRNPHGRPVGSVPMSTKYGIGSIVVDENSIAKS